jgi:hypothetical protein
MTTIRCYNCGGIGHLTQHCARYGPRYPEPGKSSQDYGEDAQRIANLFAEDIIREHEGYDGDADVDASWVQRGMKFSEAEEIMRKYMCTFCKAVPGERCRGGKSHKNRFHQAVAEHRLPSDMKW